MFSFAFLVSSALLREVSLEILSVSLIFRVVSFASLTFSALSISTCILLTSVNACVSALNSSELTASSGWTTDLSTFIYPVTVVKIIGFSFASSMFLIS